MVTWEVSGYPPGSDPPPEQQRAAEELVKRCRRSAEEHGWHDFEEGLADGFSTTDDQRHYEDREFLLDDYVRTPTERGPQIGASLTVWHFHRWSTPLCAVDGMIRVGWSENGVCEEGVGIQRSPEMLQLWLVDRPNGPFSTSMYLEDHLDLAGLDAPFAPPEGDDVEGFRAQLEAVLAALDEEDRLLVFQAISYLRFAFGKGLTERGVPGLERGDADPGTRGDRALLRAAQQRGEQMRLRVFVGMAFELDKLRPGLWSEYEAIHGSEAPHPGHR